LTQKEEYKLHNLELIRKMLNAEDFGSVLLDLFEQKSLSYRPFALQHEENFNEMLSDVFKDLNESEEKQLAWQLNHMTKELKFKPFALHRVTKLLQIAKLGNKGKFHSLFVSSVNTITSRIPKQKDLDKLKPRVITSYLKLISNWLYEYRFITSDKDKSFDKLFKRFLFGTYGLFSVTRFNPDLIEYGRLNVYRYLIQLILDTENWACHYISIFDDLEYPSTSQFLSSKFSIL